MVVASSLYIGTLVINVKKHARGTGCRYTETFVANMETFDLDMETFFFRKYKNVCPIYGKDWVSMEMFSGIMETFVLDMERLVII